MAGSTSKMKKPAQTSDDQGPNKETSENAQNLWPGENGVVICGWTGGWEVSKCKDTAGILFSLSLCLRQG